MAKLGMNRLEAHSRFYHVSIVGDKSNVRDSELHCGRCRGSLWISRSDFDFDLDFAQGLK